MMKGKAVMKQRGRILVTGGAGFLGSNFVPLIRDRATVYDSLRYQDEYFEDVDFVRADVTDYDTLKEYLSQVDTVVWLAGIVGDAAVSLDPQIAIATDVDAIQCLAENFAGKIVYMSSCSVYGASEQIADENSPLNPLSLYAENKIRAEEILKSAGNAMILRLGTLHGTSARMRFDLVVNILSRDAVLKGEIKIFSGNQHRPLVSVKDIAKLILSLVEKDYEPGIYNVASENLTIKEIGQAVKETLPDTRITYLGSEFEDHRTYRVRVDRAHDKLDFQPTLTVKDSVVEIAKLIREGRVKDPYELRYSNMSSSPMRSAVDDK